MSNTTDIRAALETALNGMSGALSTAWENATFIPVVGTAYQRVTINLAEPENEAYGAGYRENGYMQIDLCYPTKAGSNAAITKADAIRTTFARGTTFTSGSVQVVVRNTPEIRPGRIEDDRYVVAVIVQFFANLY